MTAKLSPETTHRRCPKCGETKALALFPVHKSKALGRGYCCRACRRAYDRNRKPPTGKPRGPAPETQCAVVLPAMDLNEQLACIRFRKWTGPVDRTRQLTWRIA